MAGSSVGRHVKSEVTRLGVLALEVHREEILHLDFFKEYGSATCKIRALPWVNREHGDIDCRIFALDAIDNHLEIIFSLLHLALGRAVFPMPVVEVTGMEYRCRRR